MTSVSCAQVKKYFFKKGIKYQKENENDLKDKIDFDPGKPAHYPKNQMRPNFGKYFLNFR